MTMKTSFSLYSRFMARLECGSAGMARSAPAKEKPASALRRSFSSP